MKKLLLALLFLGFAQSTIFAQLFESKSAFGVRYAVPSGTTADLFDYGIGTTGTVNIPVVPLLEITVEGSWHMLKGKELIAGNSDLKADDLSILGFVAGPVLNLGIVDLGVKGGYFFDDIHEWVLFPFAQVDIFMFSLGAEYKALGDTKWASAYINLTF